MRWTLDDTSSVPHWRPDGALRAARAAFSTRRGGVSPAPFDTLNLGRSTSDAPEHVAENRARLLAAVASTPERLATAGQVHGADVAEVVAPGHHPACDALVTAVPGIALAVTTADCMSLLYTSPGGAAAAHAGWRGTADGMPLAALDALRRITGEPASAVHVHIGPCIRGCCYEVGDEVAGRFPAEALRAVEGRQRLDLPTVARIALRAAGIAEEAIHDTGACTACEPHWYFSHRRDAGRTGRLWGVVVRTGTD
jgi:YfiH family protein